MNIIRPITKADYNALKEIAVESGIDRKSVV